MVLRPDLLPNEGAPTGGSERPWPRLRAWLSEARARVEHYFVGEDPTFFTAMLPLVVLSMILFTRSPATNYIFDEQEALLANPYVNATGGVGFFEAIHRDFWGLPADRSVGSYRPIPDMFWRLLWHVSKQPFFHHFYNVVFHAMGGALLVCLAFRVTRRRGLSWLVGALFVGCAVLTEAVSGIVGIADVLGGLGALLALAALGLPAWAMPFGVFAAVAFGLFSKESALVCVPLVPFAALVSAPLTHPGRPARVMRALLALAGALGAFVVYVELRKRWFPSPLPKELEVPLLPDASLFEQKGRELMVWFHQAPLPKDPLNNPLADADTESRIAGALRVYFRGLGQVVFPLTLSGDYSYPEEPVPVRPWFAESIGGLTMMVAPPAASIALWVVALLRERSLRAGTAGPAAALLAPTRSARPRRSMRIAGALLVFFAALVVLVELFLRSKRGAGLGVPASSACIPLFVVGAGLLVESGGSFSRPGEPARFAHLALASIGLMWFVVSYFPHSNIPVVLPTVRAERFWYFPAIGTSLVLAVLFASLHERLRPRSPRLVPAIFTAFLGFQSVQAYRHAMDYRSDVDFWEATKNAVPNSAKAHLNYSVMKGARGALDVRLAESKKALELAPDWPMAHVYTGDTLCRMKKPDEAWPYYERGFALGPNELSLVALALQCLYDEKKLSEHEDELRELAREHPGSWVAYLAVDTLERGEEHGGVDPKYRPRGYNEGPKDEKKE